MVVSYEVPEEFLPSTIVEESNEYSNLFAECDDGVENSPATEEVSVGPYTFLLRQPPDVGTLFAHRVWSGSKLLAEFLVSRSAIYCADKRTIEFGAGTALPSLVAAAANSKFSVITDYPDESVLQCLRETVGYNWEVCQRPAGKIAVVGHEWGTSIDGISEAVQRLDGADAARAVCPAFDVAFLSECLWMHRCHAALVQSLDRVLHPDTGRAIVTYAHHVPGMEKADDAFFLLAKNAGWVVVERQEHDVEYMWDKDKRITEYLCVLARCSAKVLTGDAASIFDKAS